ncbi:glycosyltransferase involved in cell wall biosynthesis [Christiangramia gaetbulicola]|uniref:Glycosyltransferase involved in cell wall biosynthesis n=1 Tax=Christiangramia gaetbulicola TaxID=703340 RepID=A0A2T6AJU6_9FLAO|nr:glycosyltransferase family 2 protein [Christiangramia gaetbulicola]PTX44081.1 glycosyltransferase involved in cell wall biosynthesis [Christiangramia gaetbulicola]
MQDFVSIIIPVYNRENYIIKTLESLKAQTFTNWECIVIDDGSTDSSVEQVQEFVSTDERFKFFRRPGDLKKGAGSCRNFGISISNGNLIQFLDSDDLLHKEKLNKQVKSYPGNDTILTAKWGGFTSAKDLKSRFKYKYHSYKNFKSGKALLNSFGRNQEFFPLHVYLTPRELINKAGKWDEELTNNDDAEFFTRVILEADKIKFVPQSVAYYRYDVPGNLSSIDSIEKVESTILSWKKIENHLKNSNCNKIYVQNAKYYLYEYLKQKFSEFLLREREFFSDKRKGKSKLPSIFKWLKTKVLK